MAKSGTLLLVSNSPDLHRVMVPVASAYDLSVVGAETIREGLTILKVSPPSCAVFDLRITSDIDKRARIKDRLKESHFPILFLNDNGIQRRNEFLPPLRLEPIAKFVADQGERLRRSHSDSGFWNWLRNRLLPTRA